MPWSISAMVRKINKMRDHREVEINHIQREGNKVEDFFANHVFFFAGTSQIRFLDIH